MLIRKRIQSESTTNGTERFKEREGIIRSAPNAVGVGTATNCCLKSLS